MRWPCDCEVFFMMWKAWTTLFHSSRVSDLISWRRRFGVVGTDMFGFTRAIRYLMCLLGDLYQGVAAPASRRRRNVEDALLAQPRNELMIRC